MLIQRDKKRSGLKLSNARYPVTLRVAGWHLLGLSILTFLFAPKARADDAQTWIIGSDNNGSLTLNNGKESAENQVQQGGGNLNTNPAVLTGGVIVGQHAGGNGTVTVTNHTNIINGAVPPLNSLDGNLIIGQDSGAVGSVVVSDTSSWDNIATATVGDGGKGSLVIEGNSFFGTDAMIIGNEQSGSGTVTLDDSRMSVGIVKEDQTTTNGYLKVNNGSTLNIINGSSVIIDARDAPTHYPTLQIGSTQAQGDAIVNIQDSSLSVPRGSIQVGNANSTQNGSAGSALLIGNNAEITGGLVIGNSPANKSASVILTNSDYNSNGVGMTVGTAGNGTYSQNGGSFTVTGPAGMIVGSGVNHASGTATFNNMNNMSIDSLIIGASSILPDGSVASGNGEMRIANSHNVTLNNTTFIGGTSDGSASGSLSLENSSLNTKSAMVLGYGKGDTGQLNLDNNSHFVGSKLYLGISGTASMNLSNHSDATVSTLTIGNDAGGKGSLTLSDHSSVIDQGGFGISTGSNVTLDQSSKISIQGNAEMQNGSSLTSAVAGADDNLQSGGIDGKGSFKIGDDTTLNINVAQGAELNVNQAYNIVHADGGITGKFTHYNQDGKIGSDAADGYSLVQGDFGHPEYDKDDVKITLSFNKNKQDQNGISGLGYGGNRNQSNVGNALTASVSSHSALSGIANILAGSDNAQRLNNLTQMDGEIASDMRTGNINNNFWVRDSVNNRLDCLEDTFRQIGNGKATSSNVCGSTGKKVNVWGTIYGSQGGQNGHSGWNYANQASDNNAGFIWGVDGEIGADGYAEDRWHIGMMMGYGSVMESSGGVSSSGESNNANIGMYFGKQVRFDNQNFFTFHGQFGYTWNIMSWHRSVNLQGAAAQYNQTLHANELGGTAHVSAEIAYKHIFNLWGTPLEVAPTGSITYLNYEQGSYHETGGNLGLHGAATNTNLGYGFMGAKIATNFNIGDVIITPHGKFGYRRAFGANQSYTNAGFEALGNSTDMSIVGVPVVQDQALTELGFDVHPTDYLTFGANYVGLYGGHSSTMSGGQLSAKIAF